MLYIMFCTLFFFSFLLNNTSSHSFLIHLIHFISIWFSNIWMCHNLISTELMAKHLLKTSLGPLAFDTLFIKKTGGTAISFIYSNSYRSKDYSAWSRTSGKYNYKAKHQQNWGGGVV